MGFVNDEFERFYQQSYGPTEAPPEQKREVKMNFVSGMFAALTSMPAATRDMNGVDATIFVTNVSDEAKTIIRQYIQERMVEES